MRSSAADGHEDGVEDGARHMILIQALAYGEWVADSDAHGLDIARPTFDQLAQIAESARFDAIFSGDSLQISPEAARVKQNRSAPLEPITIMAHLSALTTHIGLIATISTTFSEPYNVARYLASLDYLSGGRAGWNVVTSGTGNDYRNFGFDQLPSHAERYLRADEFLRVTRALWRSWDRDATRLDGEGSVDIEPSGIRRIDFRGERFAVEGPLNVPRAPQTDPVIVQAGASGDGISFAAANADIVFSMQPSADIGRAYRDAMTGRAAQLRPGAPPPLVAAGVRVILAETADAARAKFRRWLDSSDLDANVAKLGEFLDLRVSDLRLDEPIPLERLPSPQEVESRQSFYKFYWEHAAVRRATVRELTELQLHWTIVGTPKEAADALADRFLTGAADGYLFQGTDRESYELLSDRTVPLLRDAGLAQSDYSSVHFRRNIGRLVDDESVALPLGGTA